MANLFTTLLVMIVIISGLLAIGLPWWAAGFVAGMLGNVVIELMRETPKDTKK